MQITLSRFPILTVLVSAAAVSFSGCGKSSDTATTGTDGAGNGSPSATDDHGHSHDEDGGHGGHSHGAGPHGGTLADWGGGKYHVEFTVDHGRREAVVYVLGSDEKSPVPITAESVLLSINSPAFQVELQPSPLEGETAGKSSRFSGTHENLGKVQEFAGTISAQVDGTPYVAEFAEQAHGGDGHSHSHGEDDALIWRGEPIEHAGTTIRLGHHGKHPHAGSELEPAVAIMRGDQPVSDAKVFNSLLSADKSKVLAEEVPTVYEPTTAEEPAHYARGAVRVPKDVNSVVIRFRIALPGEEPATFDVPVPVE